MTPETGGTPDTPPAGAPSVSRRARFPARMGAYVRARKKRFVALVVMLAHGLGAFTSVQAIMETRTAQGAIAWAISLNTMPYVAVPLYWVFGRTKFNGYVKKRRADLEETSPVIREFIARAQAAGFLVQPDSNQVRLLERLAKLPATLRNDVELLRNGEEIFPSIFAGIARASNYVLAQFYIVRDDGLGRQFAQHLLDAATRGVRVYLLYDEIGSHQLPRGYRDRLRAGGVQVRPFHSTRGRANRFQLNFRNHRKIVVVDGQVAWVGGANVGDEYLGRHPRRTPWVDTMIKVTGPAVQAIQVPFLEDWHWASGETLDLDWTPRAAPSGTSLKVLCLPTGPADRFETCALYFLNAIYTATNRFWLASPYFVPDEQIVSALKLAALRGVEVRVLVPEDCDNALVRLSGWSFVAPLEEAGVKVYRHTNGFMHHKIMLVDDAIAAVGTANFDNRSFRLNFEIMVEVRDAAFVRQVEALFERDFAHARLSSARELETRPFPVRLAVRVARLMAPLQ